MLVHAHEFTRKHSASVNVGRKGFKTFVVSENLGGGCSWHRSNKKRVSGAVFDDILS